MKRLEIFDKIEQKEKIKIVTEEEFIPSELGLIKLRGKKNSGKTLCNDFISLDTETSWNHDEENPIGWIYQWAFDYDDYKVVGSKPSELIDALKKIALVNCLNEDNKKMVIFVHNLSYDYVYIKDWLEQEYEHKCNLLAISEHKLISFEIGGFIFKCTYRLTNMSLDKWSKEINTTHKKLVGTVDYNEIHYQDEYEKLTYNDWLYMLYDIIVLRECILKQMKTENDDVSTLPLTSTGYVRRATRKKFTADKSNRFKCFLNNRLDVFTYNAFKSEGAGGITHGNRFYQAVTVKAKIRHRDFSSHYPSQQVCSEAFPISKFIKIYRLNEEDDNFTINECFKLAKTQCVLTEIIIKDMRLRDKSITFPYAQASKFEEGKIIDDETTKYHTIEDNGRILKMSGKSRVFVTEIDLKWLYKHYTFDYEILNVWTAKRGACPKFIVDTVNEFFYLKTFWKNECKRIKKEFGEDSNEFREAHATLMRYKARLNGIFGMTYTDIIRQVYCEDEFGVWHRGIYNEEDGLYHSVRENVEELLDDYYEGFSSFMSFQLGCYTTALARNELMEFCELIGYENCLYVDTDSIFYITNDEIEARIENVNALKRKRNDEKGYYIEIDGKRTYYDQFEDECEDITEFRFLHAKCYAYICDNELHATIAGVPATNGKTGDELVTRVQELYSINNLSHGFTFKQCGGSTTKYVNNTTPGLVDINGHLTETASAAIIMSVYKTLKEIPEETRELYSKF